MSQDIAIKYDDLDIRIRMGNICFTVLHISRESAIPGWGYENHSHSTYELHFVPYGRGTLKALNKEFAITPGTFYLTGPGIIHEQKADLQDPMCEYCINFQIKIYKRSLQKSDVFLKDEIEDMLETLLNTNFWFGKDEFSTSELFIKIMEEFDNQLTGYYSYTQSLSSQIILNALRCFSNLKKTNYFFPRRNLNDSRIFIIDESFINEYAYLTPELLANKIGTSVRQLNRIMQQFFNMSFNEKLTTTRLERAKEMLKDSNLSVKAISEKIGYSNPNYFSRIFYKNIKMYPTTYKIKQNKK